MRLVPSLVCFGILLVGAPASAQWSVLEGRVAVHVDAGYQAVSADFEQTIVQRAYGEDARLAATNTVGTGPFGDVGGFVLVREQLGVGATYSQNTKSGTSVLTGTVPHPILFGSDRSANVEVGMLRHRAQATHIHVSWRIAVPAGEKLDLTVYGGPSIFNVAQGVVTGVVISEPSGPPFATVSIDQVTQDEHTRNGWGGHVGADVTYMWTTYIGLGGFVRFAAGSVDVPSGSGESSVQVGGFQSGGGLRFRF